MKHTRSKRALRVTVAMSLMVAISIVCGKYLAIPGGEILRFSFENLPILMSGILFGPAAGALVGAVADLVGCALVGYAVNPLVTLGAVAIGLTSGFLWQLLGRVNVSYVAKIVFSVGGAHLVGSVLIKTVGLSAYYAIPIGVLALWRLLNYVIVGGIEGTLLFFLLKNKALQKQFLSGQVKKEGDSTHEL